MQREPTFPTSTSIACFVLVAGFIAPSASTPPQSHAGSETNSLLLPGGGAGAGGSTSAQQAAALSMSPRPQHRSHGTGTQARVGSTLHSPVFTLRSPRCEFSPAALFCSRLARSFRWDTSRRLSVSIDVRVVLRRCVYCP